MRSLRRILATMALVMASTVVAQDKPNILIIWGDDIGPFNISAYNRGMMGYETPNIDRIANDGILFTDSYGDQSCTAGRAGFITGQHPMRTGLTKVGLPSAKEGLQKEDPTIAELLKPLGYMTGQFGKNHLGDLDEHLPTNHGFDEFFGNLYHLNAEEEPACCRPSTDWTTAWESASIVSARARPGRTACRSCCLIPLTRKPCSPRTFGLSRVPGVNAHPSA